MSRPVVVLGATGSIGSQTIGVAERLGIPIAGLLARRPGEELAAHAMRHPDARVVVTGGTLDEREWLEKTIGRVVGHGSEAVADLAAHPGATVVNGIVGASGLEASLATLDAGNRLALANKESMVAGGALIRRRLEGGGELIPVDSEHSAIHQCLLGEDLANVSRLMLTASGGPFRGWSPDKLATVTPAEALRHPVWDMGRRITIDSATLLNKGLEVIEAHFLFGLGYDRIEVVVHPQSLLHSAVEFVDGSWKGHLGQPDMRIPIQYALTFPGRQPTAVSPFTFAGRTLEFEPVDRATFPGLDLAYEAGRSGGSAPAVLNAADEIAVEAFLQGRIGFTTITSVIAETLAEVPQREIADVADVVAADGEARAVAASLVAGAC
ncbi:MAG: 1-deoxy-D-xylulose-5-phosphate reductoisomerase [Actinobacteria bacterium]|nr:1-deoxy-D-xylulose-5-phosphate reductoisomerase [Actinomycetota bacterium]